MRNKGLALLAVAALFLVAWAGDANTGTASPSPRIEPAFATSEGGTPSGSVAGYGDVPDGWQPSRPAPVDYAPPTIGVPASDGASRPLPGTDWEEDINIYTGNMLTPPGGFGTERMLSQDYSESAEEIYAAYIPSPGDTIKVYKSTDGGLTWSQAYWVAHPGNVLSSPEVVIAEGANGYGFVFFKTTAGNGDAYVGRWDLDGGGVDAIYPIKADNDTIANLAACADLASSYYLYCTYEQHGPSDPYNVYTMRSTDFGVTWSDCEGTVVDTDVQPKPDICYGGNDRVYLLLADQRQSSRPDTTTFRVKVSTNRGSTWLGSQQVGTPVVEVYDGIIGASHATTHNVWLVHVRDMDPFNGMGEGVFTYYSTNSGGDWSYGGDNGIGDGDTDNNERMPSIACNKGSGAATVSYSIVPSESLMFTWASGGDNWTTPDPINDHIHTGNFASAAGWKKEPGGGNYSTIIYAGVGPEDVWFDAYNYLGVEEEEVGGLRAVSARPSPASGRVTFAYSLTRPGSAELAVYNSSGREVARLAQGDLDVGVHEASWDCSREPAGVYLCRLDSPDGVATTRLVVSH